LVNFMGIPAWVGSTPGFRKTPTPTRQNPYPWARVQVGAGTGAGSPGGNHYLPPTFISSDTSGKVSGKSKSGKTGGWVTPLASLTLGISYAGFYS
jgi:hypothetical protein